MSNLILDYKNNVSARYGKHNVPLHLWEKISIIRDTCVETAESVYVGDEKGWYTIPKGSKGYVITREDQLKLFGLSKSDVYLIENMKEGILPVWICSLGLMFVEEEKIVEIEPFEDIALEKYIENELSKLKAEKLEANNKIIFLHPDKTTYIELTEDLKRKDDLFQSTTLYRGAKGKLLNNDSIMKMNLDKATTEEYLSLAEVAEANKEYVACMQSGYVTTLARSNFKFIGQI